MKASQILLFLSIFSALQLFENCSSQLSTSRLGEVEDLRISPFQGAPARRIVLEGSLEIKYGNSWYRVCKEGWSESESFVACGNLGFSESVPLTAQSQREGQSSDEKIGFLAVFCLGSESRLSECTSVVAESMFCISGQSVKLKCKSTNPDGLRLRGGAIVGEGRVQTAQEIPGFGQKLYGGICGNGWNLKSGNVACRQLGFGTAKEVYNGTEFGLGQAYIWLNNVRCSGKERTLDDCKLDLIDFNSALDHSSPGCSNQQLASVSCFTPFVAFEEEIQLLDGQDDSVGRVVVNIGGKWGSICSDNWGLNEAAVVCRQLGLGYASKALQNVDYMTSSGKYLEITVTNLRCSGSEYSLNECSFTPSNQNAVLNCGSNNKPGSSYVGVACTDRSPDLQLDFAKLQQSVDLSTKTLKSLECAAEEKCLAQSAYNVTDKNQTRTLLRLSVHVWNRGTADFLPWEESDRWDWHECHGHYHSMSDFAHFDIVSPDTFAKVAEGHKVSFCLADNKCMPGYQNKYNCSDKADKSNQGLSVGCVDMYSKTFDCQWIDITDVDPGTYILKVNLNPLRLVPELDFSNNEVICDMTYDGTAAWSSSCAIADDFV